MKHYHLILLMLIGLPYGAAFSQNSHVEIGKNLIYRSPVKPKGTDKYLYSTYYYQSRNVYNLKGFIIGDADYDIVSLKFNPAGSSFAVLSQKKLKFSVQILDAWHKQELHRFTGLTSPTAIAYTYDSRHFYVADARLLNMYETKNYTLTAQYPLSFSPSLMDCSSNGYFISMADQGNVIVMNQEKGSLRASWTENSFITCIRFSPDALFLGVLTSNGVLTLYDTRTFKSAHKFTNLGEARSFDFHPDGKYATVLTNDRNMVFLNFNDGADRPQLIDEDGGADYVRYLQDAKGQAYLTYNTIGAIKYKVLKGLKPNYSRMLTEELNARMNEWAKMRPDETETEYRARVNDETRLQQAKLFEQEISTRMAGDLIGSSVVSLGSYNKETSMLSLSFDNMPQIYLTVPENEVASFSDTQELEFRNVLYGLTQDEHFEMTYALVYNRKTGKSYEFNNLSRQSLDFLLSDENFVPIELVQQSSMEDVKLQAIKNDVINTAKRDNLISDNTHIQVSTNVEAGYDAEGKRINNYKVRFGYTVEAQYSIKEDFAPGKYVLEQSHAAVSMLQIVIRAFENDFKQYIKSGKKVEICVTGSADALKINGIIPYDECYGRFDNEPYYLDEALQTITVSHQTGIRTNEQLAFLRAAGVKDYIDSNLANLQSMNTTYIYNIELAKGTGGEYRRINVEFKFIDAF